MGGFGWAKHWARALAGTDGSPDYNESREERLELELGRDGDNDDHDDDGDDDGSHDYSESREERLELGRYGDNNCVFFGGFLCIAASQHDITWGWYLHECHQSPPDETVLMSVLCNQVLMLALVHCAT